MGNVLECEGDYDASEVALQHALSKAETETQRASILNDIAWVLLRKGDVDAAQQLGEEALQLCDEIADGDRKQVGDDSVLLALVEMVGRKRGNGHRRNERRQHDAAEKHEDLKNRMRFRRV